MRVQGASAGTADDAAASAAVGEAGDADLAWDKEDGDEEVPDDLLAAMRGSEVDFREAVMIQTRVLVCQWLDCYFAVWSPKHT